MPPVVTRVDGSNFRVQVHTEAHSNADALSALVKASAASKTYQKAKSNYELRLVSSDGSQFLELHKRNAISRLGSFLKGTLTGSRAQNTQRREQSRADAAQFYAESTSLTPALKALHQHLRAAGGVDPVAIAARDPDEAAVTRDINSTMTKVRTFILNNPDAQAQLRSHIPRDGRVYAPVNTLIGLDKSALLLLETWSPSWSPKNTSAFLMDLGLQLTRETANGPTLKDLRPDVNSGVFASIVFKTKQAASQGTLQSSSWAAEFLPAGTQVNQGVSPSSLRLLQMLDQTPGVQLHEIEAVFNGLTSYWDSNPIKQYRGEFHTTAEAWAAYNQYLDSNRVSRGLSGLAPESIPLINFLKRTPEGKEKILAAYNAFNRGVGTMGKDQSLEQLHQTLRTLENNLSGRDLFQCYVPSGTKMVKLIPDEPRYQDGLKQIATNYRQMKLEQNLRRQELSYLQLIPLIADLSDRQAIKVLAANMGGLPDMIDATPEGPPFDNHVSQLRNLIVACREKDSEENAVAVRDAMRGLFAELPGRSAFGYMFPDLEEWLSYVPDQSQFTDRLKQITNTYDQLSREVNVKEARKMLWAQIEDLELDLPNRNLLKIALPELEKEISALPPGSTSQPDLSAALKKFKEGMRAARADESAKKYQLKKELHQAVKSLIASAPPSVSSDPPDTQKNSS